MLDLDLLHAFASVADHGGFTRAAAALHRTQSGVSMQVRRLEDAVGARLFHREGRRVRLTPEGEKLLGYTRRIMAISAEATEALSKGAGVSGTVRVGCIEDYATRLLPDLLARFWQANPGITVEVSTAVTSGLLPRMDKDLDLVIAVHPARLNHPDTIRRDQVVWARGAADTALRAGVLPLAFNPEGCLVRGWMTEALEARGRRWRCAYVSSSIAAVEAAVRTGLAVSAFKAASMDPLLTRLASEDGFPDFPGVSIVLHTPKRVRSTAVSRLAAYLAEGLAAASAPERPTRKNAGSEERRRAAAR